LYVVRTSIGRFVPTIKQVRISCLFVSLLQVVAPDQRKALCNASQHASASLLQDAPCLLLSAQSKVCLQLQMDQKWLRFTNELLTNNE